MGIEAYLESVKPQENKETYLKIILTLSQANTEPKIDYVELRPDGDYIFTTGRLISLRELTSAAGIMPCSFVYSLRDLPSKVVENADFGFDIGREGTKIGRVRISAQHLLAIGELERSLAKQHDGIIRGIGSYANI